MGDAMNIMYRITRQRLEKLVGARGAMVATSMMVASAFYLGNGTAGAVTLPALVDQELQTSVPSPEASPPSGLTGDPSLEAAILGSESGEETAMFDIKIQAPKAADPAPADTLEDSLTEADGYPMMSSARGFESLGSGRGWGGSVVAAGGAAGILAAEFIRHADHGFRFGDSWTPQKHDTPLSTHSLGSDNTPGDTTPADVPEPGTLALFAAGIAIATAFRRRLTRA